MGRCDDLPNCVSSSIRLFADDCLLYRHINSPADSGGGKAQGARCEVVKCEVPVRGIKARRRVICEAGMCEAQRTTGAAGVVIGCEPLKRN